MPIKTTVDFVEARIGVTNPNSKKALCAFVPKRVGLSKYPRAAEDRASLSHLSFQRRRLPDAQILDLEQFSFFTSRSFRLQWPISKRNLVKINQLGKSGEGVTL